MRVCAPPCDVYQVPRLPPATWRRAYCNEARVAVGIEQHVRQAELEVTSPLFDTPEKSQWRNVAFFSIFVCLFVCPPPPPPPAGVRVWQAVLTSGRVGAGGGRQTRLFLMAETGSLVKRLGLAEEPAGITRLSTRPGPQGPAGACKIFFFSPIARWLMGEIPLMIPAPSPSPNPYTNPPSTPPPLWLMSRGRARVREEVGGLRRGGGSSGCCSLADVTCSPQTSAKLIHDSVSVCRRGLTHHVPVACLRCRCSIFSQPRRVLYCCCGGDVCF